MTDERLSPEMQLRRWVLGEPLCPNDRGECCPDFSCCVTRLAWPKEKREMFLAADDWHRERMLFGSLGALVETVNKRRPFRVTGGERVAKRK